MEKRPDIPDPEITPEKTAENGGSQTPKSGLSKLRWESVNDVTWKLTRGKGTLVPASHGQWGGYHTTRAVAWLIGLGKGKWVARYKDRRSRPVTLNRAKTWCVEMVKGQRDGFPMKDDLNLMTALIRDAGPEATFDEPVDLMNGRRGSISSVPADLRRAIIDVELGSTA